MNTPTPGALRAAEKYVKYTGQPVPDYILETRHTLAKIIDSESGLAECVEALSEAANQIERFYEPTPTDLLRKMKAALAKAANPQCKPT